MNKFIIAGLLSAVSATDFSVNDGAINFSLNFDKATGSYKYAVNLASGQDLWLAFGNPE